MEPATGFQTRLYQPGPVHADCIVCHFRSGGNRRVNAVLRNGPFVRRLVLPDLTFDFNGMRARVGPSVHQVLGTQMRVGGQQGLLAGAETPSLLKKKNGNPSSHDTRFTAAEIGPGVDSWKIAVEFANHPLENLRLLAAKSHKLPHGMPLFIVADA